MNIVKWDLEYFSGIDYIVKTDVVQIIINKIDGLKSDDIEIDDKTYRWKGRFERGNDIYDKAWNANKNWFQYKAYNMDPNNETPLECVYLKCMVINQKVKHILTVKLQMVEWNILKKC